MVIAGIAWAGSIICCDGGITSPRRRVEAIDVEEVAAEPRAMTTSNPLVQPYLFFGGHCEDAIAFYRTAVGAEVQLLMRYNESPQPHPQLPECFGDRSCTPASGSGKRP